MGMTTNGIPRVLPHNKTHRFVHGASGTYHSLAPSPSVISSCAALAGPTAHLRPQTFRGPAAERQKTLGCRLQLPGTDDHWQRNLSPFRPVAVISSYTAISAPSGTIWRIQHE